MTDTLRPEVVRPTRSHSHHAWFGVLGCGAIGVALALMPSPPASAVTVVVRPAPAVAPVITPVAPRAQAVHSREVSLVISAGAAAYMKLADIGDGHESLPAHGKPRLISQDGNETAVASVQNAHVPPAYRRWLGRKVKVDNTCQTTVTGFAVIARLTGDTGYAGIESETWTAHSVLEHGSVALAATLAGCTGTLARDAELPDIVVPQEIENPDAAARARAALIASAPARETQTEYAEFDTQHNWWDAQDVQFTTRVLRHPTTGVTFVSIHGHMEHGCGDPEVNVWGLFRIEADGSLAAVQLRKLGDLSSIDKLVDLDNDGELELVGRPWLGLDTVITRPSGEELDRLAQTFFGCPC